MKNPPDPSRVIEGLRDTGYTFNTAVADIVDNSITHGKAKNVWVELSLDFHGLIQFAITDDGAGMDNIGLLNAMKYGSKTLSDPMSLGKFGMGLKTASSAFCRRYSIISREKTNATFSKVTWDLDHVAEANDWDMLEPPVSDFEQNILDRHIKKSRGTLVSWETVDRIIREYVDPGGRYAQKALKIKLADLEFHLGMVYQQFLDKKFKDVPDVKIFVNREEVKPWDPFCTSEDKSEKLVEEETPVENQDGTEVGKFNIAFYAIPNKYNFSSDESLQKAKLSNKMQGIYVYRHGRLIHYGDWLGIRTLEPHSTLARVKLSFDHQLDGAFKVDLKKSEISLDVGMLNYMKTQFLPAPLREANERYRKGKKSDIQLESKNAHHDSNILISGKEKDVSQSKKKLIDENTGEHEITNKEGKTKVVLQIVQPESDNELHIIPVSTLDDGVLWKPTVHENKTAVLLNTSHVFYDRVYVPNHNESVTIQGLDAMLWSLAESEYSTFNDRTKKAFETLRYEVSKILKDLTSELPES